MNEIKKLNRGRPSLTISQEVKDKIIALYNKGCLQKQISDQLALSPYQVKKAFTELNLKKPLRYGRTRKLVLQKLNGNWKNFTTIAQEVGCSPQFVGQVFHDYMKIIKGENGFKRIKAVDIYMYP
tara:strand:+ start:1610 stop:1984 length:375 start_codon:yes stop_codon:yes gene_type:complete